jgi:hypothetical protein
MSRMSVGTAASRAVFAAAAALSLAACGDDPATMGAPARATAALGAEAGEQVFYGQSMPVGNGYARTYLIVDGETPRELGVEMNAGALESLPGTDDHAGHGLPSASRHHHGPTWDLPIPQQATAVTPFRVVGLGWEENGHGAPYNRPHFDFHFYTVDESALDEITPENPQWAQLAGAFPSPAYWPQNTYPLNLLVGGAPADMAVPRMGMHWLDVTSPELQRIPNPPPFTRTLFMGSWGGKLIFYEPMITRATLQSGAEESVAIAPAAAYAPAGNHPTAYRYYWVEAGKRRRVALTSFVAR